MKKINIMPMAGLGERFKVGGFNTPKPFININDNPMFIEASKCMPVADKWIYICHKEYLNKYEIYDFIKKDLKQITKTIKMTKATNGQAETCLLAADFIGNNDQIFIHSCDTYIKYDLKLFDKLIKKNDVIIFTAKAEKYHLENIDSFGWVHSKNDIIQKISCKTQASYYPKNDNIIVGTFAFRTKEFFINSVNSLLNNNLRINNEFYMDMAINESIKLGYKVYDFLVDNYISWGSPEELEKSQNKYNK